MMVRKNDGYELFAKELCKIIFGREDFKQSDRPDIITANNDIGIEVTRAISEEIAQFYGEVFSYKKEISKIKKPRNYNVTETEFFRTINSSRGFSDNEIRDHIELINITIAKKMKKLINYTSTNKKGIFIYTETPSINKEERKQIFKYIFDNHINLCDNKKCTFDYIIFFMEDIVGYMFVSIDKIEEIELNQETEQKIKHKIYEEIERSKITND